MAQYWMQYRCRTCAHSLGVVVTLDTDPQAAADECAQPPAGNLCPKCSQTLRADGSPYGDAWELTTLRLQPGRWLSIVGGRVLA